MKNWYKEVFLPSIINQALSAGGWLWLTAKQTQVICNNWQNVTITNDEYILHDDNGVKAYFCPVKRGNNARIFVKRELTPEERKAEEARQQAREEEAQRRHCKAIASRHGAKGYKAKMDELQTLISDCKKWIAEDTEDEYTEGVIDNIKKWKN